MNGVNPSSYPVVQSPYGTHLDISKDLQKVPAGSVNTDSFVRFDSNFSYITMEDALRGDFSAVKSPMDAPINAFMDGKLSETELQAEYERLLEKELFGSAENPTGPLTDAQKETASRFYDRFREKILAAAVERNNAEGQQYITGERNAQRGWSYYNSDYYYASESAISAITAGAQAVAQEHDSTFTVPDYLAKGETHRYNFNSALAGDPFIVSENHFVLDPDVVPPKHFQWFFESGGNATAQGSIQLTSMTVSNADGTKTVTDYTTDGFDPTNSCKGRTWVCWTDESGTEHRQEAEFRLDAQGKPRKVSDLLSPSKQDTESASLLNRFLANLQCYAKGYFERFAVLSPNLDLRI